MAGPITEDVLPVEGTEEIEVARSWRILILSVVLGVVLTACALLLLGVNQVGRLRVGSALELGLFLDQAQKEARLFEELSALGADPAPLRARYDALLTADRDTLRPDEVARLLKDLHGTRDRLEPISGSHLNATFKSAGQRIARLDKARESWAAAYALWGNSVTTVPGRLVVTVGLEHGPPTGP